MARGWRVAAAAFTTPLLALILLSAVVALAEIAARSGYFQTYLPAPSVGSPSRMLDLQLAKVEALVRTEGGIDCLFLGNSLALYGLDPDAFAGAFEAQAGQRPRCFNFAVPGIAASGMVAIAGILARDHRPGLMIYGVTPRDFNDAADAPAVETIPWVRYRSGVVTLDGWLAEHSYAYRYYLTVAGGHLHDPSSLRKFAAGAPRGFYANTTAAVFDQAAFERARRLVSGQMEHAASDVQLQALDGLLELRGTDVQVLLVELPLHLPVAEWSPAAAATYRRVMDRVQRRALAAAVPLWTPPPDLVPADGWIDLWHLNARGAAIFSRWLGERAARAVATGELHAPRADTASAG
jgi:hypothetical protein